MRKDMIFIIGILCIFFQANVCTITMYGELRNAIHSKNFKKVKELVNKYGIDINHRYTDGTTPLHLAAAKGNKKIIDFLLQHKADLNIKNKTGDKPLGYAIIKGLKNIKLVKYLVENGTKQRVHKTIKEDIIFSIFPEKIKSYLKTVSAFDSTSKKLEYIKFTINNQDDKDYYKDIISLAFCRSITRFFRSKGRVQLERTIFYKLFKEAKKDKKLKTAIKNTFGKKIDDDFRQTVKNFLQKKEIAVAKTKEFWRLFNGDIEMKKIKSVI